MTEDKQQEYKVSAVSYANTLPFVYGLTRYPQRPEMVLSFDNPAESAFKLLSGAVDIGLVPIAVIPHMPYHEIIPGYCLGANGPVRTVLLVSTVPLGEIKSIRIDYQSRTSNMLTRLLAKEFWKISPEWLSTTKEDEARQLQPGEAKVIIGDRVFLAEGKYPYSYDAAEEWKKWTGLPFVFATWTANRPISPSFTKAFTQALQYGISHIPEAAELNTNKQIAGKVNLVTYLTGNLSYILDNTKLVAVKLFLDKISRL